MSNMKLDKAEFLARFGNVRVTFSSFENLVFGFTGHHGKYRVTVYLNGYISDINNYTVYNKEYTVSDLDPDEGVITLGGIECYSFIENTNG